MRRLNLDVFEPDDGDSSTETSVDKGKRDLTQSQVSGSGSSSSRRTTGGETASATATPRFIPVGFFVHHLRLLDDAVIGLRRQGHWKASKSAIIRALIQENGGRLQEAWLFSQKGNSGNND